MGETIGRYCLNTSTIRNCGLGLPEKIALTARVGYQGIELWVSEIETYLEEGHTLADLKRLLDQHGLQVPNLIAFFQWANPNDAARASALEEARGVFAMAQALGCSFVAAPPAGIADRTDISPEFLARAFRELLDVARGMGVEPLLEFWGHARTLGSLREAMQMLAILDDPSAKLLGDVFHMAKTEGSFELLKELDGSQLGLFHVNDYPEAEDIRQLTDAQRVYPGDGVAPLTAIFATLREIGYRGMYSLELFNQEYERAGAEAVARTGLEKMRRCIEN